MRVAEDNKGLGSEAAHPPPAPPPVGGRGRATDGGDAHSGRLRCLQRLRLQHGTLLGVRYGLRTSGVAFPFVASWESNR